MNEDAKGALSFLPEGFYDILSILIPGLCFLLILGILDLPQLPIAIPENAYQLFAYLVVGYVAGHALYSSSATLLPKVANYIRQDPRESFLATCSDPLCTQNGLFCFGNPPKNELVMRIQEKWGFVDVPQQTYLYHELCRNYVHVMDKERASFIRKEQAYGELARSLALASVLLIPVALLLSPLPLGDRVEITGIMAACSVIFFSRYLHARQINAGFVYLNFLVLRQQELGGEHGQAIRVVATAGGAPVSDINNQTAYFGAIRSVISVSSAHPFRFIPISDFGHVHVSVSE